MGRYITTTKREQSLLDETDLNSLGYRLVKKKVCIYIYFHYFSRHCFQLVYSWIEMSKNHQFPKHSYFKIWSWKSKVTIMDGHQRSRLYSMSNNLSIHIPFVPWQSTIPFLKYSHFKFWTWKSKLKGMGGVSYSGSDIVSIHIPFVPCQSDHPFLIYGLISRGVQNLMWYVMK